MTLLFLTLGLTATLNVYAVQLLHRKHRVFIEHLKAVNILNKYNKNFPKLGASFKSFGTTAAQTAEAFNKLILSTEQLEGKQGSINHVVKQKSPPIVKKHSSQNAAK